MAGPLIAPSILAADFAELGDEAAAVTGADWLHVDVMDNHFVPNLTIGLPVVEALLKRTAIPMDCHLMIENPDKWAPPYAEAGAYNVTFHAEATENPVGVARDIRAAGAKAGLSVKPGTPIDPYLEILRHFDTLLIMSVEPGFGGQKFIPEVLPKVGIVRRLVDAGELTIVVEIDGGINEDTIEEAALAGVDCFVAGSAVYSAEDPAVAVESLRRRYLAECLAVARAEGADLRDDLIDEIVGLFAKAPEDMTTSMLTDRESHRRLEWDIRNGVISRKGARHGLPTPISDGLVALLAAASDGPG